MPENEFERKIQDRMEELRLHPSDSVWLKVEEELRNKRKRRIVFFIILLAGLSLIGYLGYNFLHTYKKPEIAKQEQTPSVAAPGKTNSITEQTAGEEKKTITADKEISSEKTDGVNENTKKTQPAKNEIGLQGEKNTTASNNKMPADIQDKTGQNKTGNRSSLTRAARKNQQPYRDVTVKTKIVSTSTQEKKTTQAVAKKDDIVKNETKLPEENKPVINRRTSTETVKEDAATENTQVKDSVAGETASAKANKEAEADSLLSDETSVPAITQKKKKTSRLTFGIDLSAGIASRKKDIGSFQKSATTNNDMSANVPTGPITGGGATGIVILPPSGVKPGQGFKAGVTAQLELSKRSKLISGLRYAYLSEKIKISSSNWANSGNAYLNSAFGLVYRSVQEKNYTNKYHFIELPLLYDIRLNKGNKVGISWNGGVSASYLLSSNALVYDTVAYGIYYKDMAAFNRFHVSLQTGFSFVFGNNRKLQWSVGPELSLDMRKLMKQDAFDKNRYLMYGGITGRVFFGKPKK